MSEKNMSEKNMAAVTAAMLNASRCFVDGISRRRRS